MRFIFDLVEGSRIRNTIHGREFVRRVRVTDLPTAALGTAWITLLNILKDPQCPPLNIAHPDPMTGAFLEEHVLVSVEKPKRYADLDLIYRAAPITPGGQDIIAWTVTDTHISDHVLTNQTGDQQMPLQVWYKSGTAETISVKPAGATTKGAQVHKVLVSRVIRVTGRATRQQWYAVRRKIRTIRGHLNADNWGGYPRGTWLFFGPNTHTIDRGNTYDIALEFAEKPNGGWYPTSIYRDENGEIPNDVASEAAARSTGPPFEAQQSNRNGILIASVYREAAFSSFFDFTPDQEPNPS